MGTIGLVGGIFSGNVSCVWRLAAPERSGGAKASKLLCLYCPGYVTACILGSLGDLLLEQFDLRECAPMADGGMLAGVGLNLGAIDGEGDLTHLEHPHLYGHCENLLKAAFEQRVVGPAESADAVVIGVKVCAKQTHCHVLIGGAFNLPTAEGARRVGIDEQAKHQGRRILAAARPSFIDLGLAQIEQADRFHDEM